MLSKLFLFKSFKQSALLINVLIAEFKLLNRWAIIRGKTEANNKRNDPVNKRVGWNF